VGALFLLTFVALGIAALFSWPAWSGFLIVRLSATQGPPPWSARRWLLPSSSCAAARIGRAPDARSSRADAPQHAFSAVLARDFLEPPGAQRTGACMAAMSRGREGPEMPGQRGSSRDASKAESPRTLADRVRGRITTELNVRKDRLTETLDDVAETVRRVGEPLREPPYAALADYVETAAGRIEQLATDLRDRDVDELARDLGDLARRRPAVFVGATLAAGIVAARFLKSSSRASPSTRTRD
jgi:hypothetical protein